MLDFSYYSAVLELLKGAIYVEHGKTFPMFHLGKVSLGKSFTWEKFIIGGGGVKIFHKVSSSLKCIKKGTNPNVCCIFKHSLVPFYAL